MDFLQRMFPGWPPYKKKQKLKSVIYGDVWKMLNNVPYLTTIPLKAWTDHKVVRLHAINKLEHSMAKVWKRVPDFWKIMIAYSNEQK